MRRVATAVFLGTVFAALPAKADYEGRRIGNWIVSAEEDRFGEGGAFIAMTTDGSYALAVRCLRKKLSIAVLDGSSDPKPLSEGAAFGFKFRVDKQPIVETAGLAISSRLIELITDKNLVKAMRDGRETAMKIETKSASSVHIFKMAGSTKAFSDLSKECPLD